LLVGAVGAGLLALGRLLRPCGHDVVVCAHGDEINRLGGLRRLCTLCGRAWPAGQPAGGLLLDRTPTLGGAVVIAVFVSAVPSARAHALPALISGFETEVPEEHFSAGSFFLRGLLQPSDFRVPPPEDVEAPVLVARPTGREWRGLPWWEAS
jgi:hypothetical protein